MDYNNYNDQSWMEDPRQPQKGRKAEWRCPVSVVLVLLCIAIVATMMLTFTLTSNWVRQQDFLIIKEQQQTIDFLNDTLLGKDDPTSDNLQDPTFEKLRILASLFEQCSYYSDQFDKEKMLDRVLRAYTEATGDNYAAYFSEEEYAALSSDKAGVGVGIGVSVINELVVVEGQEFLTFNITKIFKNAPAENSDLRAGDHIYAIEIDGEYKSVSQMGGYTPALNAVRGEAGSTVKLLAFRFNKNGGYEIIEVAIVRNTYMKDCVTYRVSETDAAVGVVQIEEFDYLTPVQFKEAIQELQKQGIEYFVFDVRNNPGGDLQSIRAVLSYLLEDGDLILSIINNKGIVEGSVYAGAVTYAGASASCSVKPEEVGMFANLKMVVLCNGNTASAAEVFTASLRDHKNVTIIGETTFGKGILQHYYSLSDLTAGAYDGYVKMTTHTYVTECGVTYHDIGIAPTEGYAVALPEEALEYYFHLLPEHLDTQLQKAVQAVKSK